MKTRPLFTIPGIRDDGARTVHSLGAAVAGACDMELCRAIKPISHTWNARYDKYTDRMARMLLTQVRPGGDVLAHSYGCLIAVRMMEMAQDHGWEELLFRNVILISPAADRDTVDWETLHYDRGLVLTNPLDIAIHVGSLNPWHPFGRAGVFGFKTNDQRLAQELRFSRVGPFNHTKCWFGEKGAEWTRERVSKFLLDGRWEMGDGKGKSAIPGRSREGTARAGIPHSSAIIGDES